MALEKIKQQLAKTVTDCTKSVICRHVLRNVIIRGGVLSPRIRIPQITYVFFEALHFLSMVELTSKLNKHPLNGKESSQWQKANKQQNSDQC